MLNLRLRNEVSRISDFQVQDFRFQVIGFWVPCFRVGVSAVRACGANLCLQRGLVLSFPSSFPAPSFDPECVSCLEVALRVFCQGGLRCDDFGVLGSVSGTVRAPPIQPGSEPAAGKQVTVPPVKRLPPTAPP